MTLSGSVMSDSGLDRFLRDPHFLAMTVARNSVIFANRFFTKDALMDYVKYKLDEKTLFLSEPSRAGGYSILIGGGRVKKSRNRVKKSRQRKKSSKVRKGRRGKEKQTGGISRSSSGRLYPASRSDSTGIHLERSGLRDSMFGVEAAI
jgi:hypothetical protein